jgi:hypothetical protein
MILKEKFLELTNSECEHDSYCEDPNCKYDGQVVCCSNIRKSERCEVIADEFAIGFAEWINDNCWNIDADRFLYQEEQFIFKELLEIYKKENEL